MQETATQVRARQWQATAVRKGRLALKGQSGLSVVNQQRGHGGEIGQVAGQRRVFDFLQQVALSQQHLFSRVEYVAGSTRAVQQVKGCVRASQRVIDDAMIIELQTVKVGQRVVDERCDMVDISRVDNIFDVSSLAGCVGRRDGATGHQQGGQK